MQATTILTNTARARLCSAMVSARWFAGSSVSRRSAVPANLVVAHHAAKRSGGSVDPIGERNVAGACHEQPGGDGLDVNNLFGA